MSKKWEYGFAHVDAETGFLLRDFNHAVMSDVFDVAPTDPKGTYGIGEVLRIAGTLGWELVCFYRDKIGEHLIFKREIEK
jgi:hypothetical protein